ncbi:MAG: crossover junction endodeoxyribonuclease RuvC [Clostridia bacterium]|nr:crossover junction endodeoxyribonuclease RuvC [Clostridia bacterium]
MIVLGIDPGLATLGWGVIEAERGKQHLVAYGCILTTPKQKLPERLLQIQQDMQVLLLRYQPEEIAFEELFFAKNTTTAFTVGAARGVCIGVCAVHTLFLYEYTPMQVKQAVAGFGGAEKRQVQQMVKILLHLEDIPKPDDAADALAIALTHAATGPVKNQFMMK